LSTHRGYGVHHIAIGVKDLESMRSFYKEVLGFSDVFVDFPQAEYPALSEVVRAPHPVYGAVLFSQAAGGIIVELVQMIDPVPRPIRKPFRYGDVGLGKMTIAVSDVEQICRELRGRIDWCTAPKSVSLPGRDDYRFVFGRDPEGNLIEFTSGFKASGREGFGGVVSVGIGVTNLERSVLFYRTYLGFDDVLIHDHDHFSGLLDEVIGGEGAEVRSCVLQNREAESIVELVEVANPRGRSIPFGTRWGDFGYLQVCLNGNQGDDIFDVAGYFEKEGMEFLCGPQMMNDERQGAFFYMTDPDGIPVEFLIFLK
jgi:catechol 2,3-dioxygenase-like lactoylglutathione lyase family enzyme